jgi:pilus assembly protein CpaE
MILRSMRSGARDFLRLPIIEDELATVIERTAEYCAQHPNSEPKKRGRAVAVFSSKGGCGCSLIATNLALLQNSSTALVDLNLQAGDLELLLGVRPKFSLADVVENRDRLDNALLTSYLTQHSKNVSLLAAPLNAESAEDIEPRHVYEVMELLRERFDQTIIDTPHSFDAVTISALDHADQILVVLTLEINAIRATRRALEIFDRLGYPRKKIRLVVNRYSKNVELDQKQVEQFLGERVVGFIQSDYRAAVNSINLGQPLIESAPASKVAADLRSIAAKLFDGSVDLTTPTENKRSFNGFFRRQPSTIEDFGLNAALTRANLGEAR